MGYKILKGAMVGILLGVCGGILLTSVLHIAGGGSVRDVVSLFREGNMKMLFAGQKISDEDQADLEAVFVDSGETESLSGDVDDVAEKSGICADVYEDALKSPEDVVVRFHVRANSDSETDLALKYEVRDAVLALLAEDLQKAENDSEAILYLAQNLSEIRNTARAVVEEAGYHYDVKAYITREEFPIREYGDLVLPAGTYRALRIDIGEAKGENFWCMLYPMMCYTMDAGAVVDSADAEIYEVLIYSPSWTIIQNSTQTRSRSEKHITVLNSLHQPDSWHSLLSTDVFIWSA